MGELYLQDEDEAAAFSVVFVDGEAAVQLAGNKCADGKPQSVALRQVLHLVEGLEEVLFLLVGDARAVVGHDKMAEMCAFAFELEPYLTRRGVEGGVVQQVKDDTLQLFGVRLHFQRGCVDHCLNVGMHLVTYLVHRLFAERPHVEGLRLVGLQERAFKRR